MPRRWPALTLLSGLFLLAACTPQFGQQASNSPEATPSTPAAEATPSTAPTPAESPSAAASPSPAKLLITKLPFHLGEVGVGYLAVALGAKGGVPPYKWSIQGGTYPPGLTLSSGGSASGKPTAAGTFSFTVGVSDSAGASATGPGSIFVFRRIAFTTSTATCSGTYLTGCTTQLKFTGGASSAPKVKVTQNLALWPPLPTGSTFTVKAGVVNVSIGPPICQLGNGTAIVTVVLVDQSPCYAGFVCTSGKLTLTINLPGAC